MVRRSRTSGPAQREARLGWWLSLPAVGIVMLIALLPLAWTVWDSLHLRDLRMPWRGEPFIGVANYLEAFGHTRFWDAVAHTLFFTIASVSLEIVLGLCLALLLHREFYGRGGVRTVALIPWAIPTVVAALVWRFLFNSPGGAVNTLLIELGIQSTPIVWFVHPFGAWVPVILADVWKTTPFVALLLLAGLQNIDASLYEAARIDGAGPWQQFRHVTFPLLRPAILVALIFRTLDALRVFDLVYVLTAGGPGTATEPIALFAFNVLFQNLRFGFGAALSVIVFLAAFLLAVIYIRLLGRDLVRSQ